MRYYQVKMHFFLVTDPCQILLGTWVFLEKLYLYRINLGTVNCLICKAFTDVSMITRDSGSLFHALSPSIWLGQQEVTVFTFLLSSVHLRISDYPLRSRKHMKSIIVNFSRLLRAEFSSLSDVEKCGIDQTVKGP